MLGAAAAAAGVPVAAVPSSLGGPGAVDGCGQLGGMHPGRGHGDAEHIRWGFPKSWGYPIGLLISWKILWKWMI